MSTWMILASGANVGDLAGDAVVEAGAERDQQVGLLHRGGRRGRAVHAGHAERQRVIVGEHAARHQRRDDVDAGQFGQLAQRLGRTRLEHAAADVQHRPLRLHDQLGGLLDHPRVALGGRPVAGERRRDLVVARPVPRHLVLQHVLRQVDQRRAWAAGGGDVERLPDRHRDLLRRHHQFVVLGARARDAERVALLEGVGADRRRAHLTGDADHRDRVHEGVHQRRHEVGRRRAGRHHRHARPPGDVGVALGHVPGALLVAHEHVPDRRFEQRVVGGQDAPAGQAEHHVDPLELERSDQRLCSGHFRHCCLLVRAGRRG